MIAVRKNILHSLIRMYRNGRIFVPDAALWLRREVERADFAGRPIELKNGAIGRTLQSGLAMIHDQLLVIVNDKKRFVPVAEVKSIGRVVFGGGRVVVKSKKREYEGKEEEILDAALDDGRKV